MDLAALIVAVIALLVAVASARYTRKQAEATGKMAEIEDDKAHEARRPDVRLTFTRWISETNLAELEIRNHHGMSLGQVRVEVMAPEVQIAGFEADDEKVVDPIEVVADAPRTGYRPREHVVEQLEPNDPARVPFHTVNAGAWDDNQVTFRLTIRGQSFEREWEPRLVRVELPPPGPWAMWSS